jgi:hypothetical protein
MHATRVTPSPAFQPGPGRKEPLAPPPRPKGPASCASKTSS